MPFKAAENLNIGETELHEANKLFLDAPLVQYKYREPIMIGDVYKFIEHVSKIDQCMVARALFLIYFPRFGSFIENPLKEIINIKILKSNLNVIRCVDETIVSLITTRYANINDYKDKIHRGIMLPSHIRSLLKENNLLPSAADSSALSQTQSSTLLPVVTSKPKNTTKPYLPLKLTNLNNTNSSVSSPILYSPFSVETTVPQSSQYKEENELNELIDKLELKKKNETSVYTNSSVFFPVCKTIDYMKLYEDENNQINHDLDHVSFDKKKDLMLHEQQNQKQHIENTSNSLDVFYDNNISVIIDENNNPCDVEESLVDYQEPQLAAKCFELTVNNNYQSKRQQRSSIAELNLATLTLPQLNNLAESFNNASGSAMASPRPQETSHVYQFSKQNEFQSQHQQQQFISKLNYNSAKPQNLLNTSGCMSPQSPKYNSNQTFHTPKTPSNLSQYQEKQSEYSVWSNGTISNPSKLNMSNGFYNPSTVTPPPSAGFKTNTPLSVITRGSSSGPVGSRVNSPSSNFQLPQMLSPNTAFMKYQQPFNDALIKSGIRPEEINEILQEQFYGSAITRINMNKFMNANNKGISSYNSNTDLTTASTSSTNPFGYQSSKNTDLNSKSPSSTSSGVTQSQQVQQFHNPNHRVHTSHNYQQHTWVGRLPPKVFHDNSIYSRKVFLGGLPWDVNQIYLIQLLQKYGSVKLEIPGKDQKHPRVSNLSKGQERSTPGYVYIIFEHESAVQRMLSDCRKEIKNGGEHYFYTIFIPSAHTNQSTNGYYNFNHNLNKRGKAKEVEVIPWNQEDTSYVPQNKSAMLPAKIDSRTTIFVGALHGMLNAHGLAKVMNEVFGEVIHAGLDTDKYKYPIGSGRVTFRNRDSYVKAIKSKFVTIKANQEPVDPSPKFEKTIQIDPYLEDAKCCVCNHSHSENVFCRNENCLDYYCKIDWNSDMHDRKNNGEHMPLSRQNKSNHSFKSYEK